MNSVRIYATDLASPRVERLAAALGMTNPREALGLFVHFMVRASERAPSGILDPFTPAQLAAFAGWTGRADIFLEALLAARVVCKPLEDLRHRSCPAVPRWSDGEPARGALSVCGWEVRQGYACREYQDRKSVV